MPLQIENRETVDLDPESARYEIVGFGSVGGGRVFSREYARESSGIYMNGLFP